MQVIATARTGVGAGLAQGTADMATHQPGLQGTGLGSQIPRLGRAEQPLPQPHSVQGRDHLDQQQGVADEGPKRQPHLDIGHAHQLDQGDKHPYQEDIHHQPGLDPAQQTTEGAQGVAVHLFVEPPQHQHDGADVDQRQADQGQAQHGPEK
ncbi:hypothetical protein D3C79_720870 [compost metagenome]